MNLVDLGWLPVFAEAFEPFREEGFVAARVAREEKSVYLVVGEAGELTAELSGKLRHEAASRAELPTVGDWVVVEPRPDDEALIHAVLPRKSAFSRKRAGFVTEEQIIAANIDSAFLVSGLDGGRNFNIARIERYLTLARESDVTPVIVLNKADLCDDVEACVAQVAPVAADVPVLVTSALTLEGVDVLRDHLGPGRTVAFLGPSGVGKSSLINDLLGEDRLPVGEVREDDAKGRQTTTWRQLITLPGGGLVIDTPGIRELQMWGDEETLADSFADIEELALECKFSDCEHRTEPDCAVKAAVEAGDIQPERLASFQKQQKELRRLEIRKEERARIVEQSKNKQIGKWRSEMKKQNPKHR